MVISYFRMINVKMRISCCGIVDKVIRNLSISASSVHLKQKSHIINQLVTSILMHFPAAEKNATKKQLFRNLQVLRLYSLS